MSVSRATLLVFDPIGWYTHIAESAARDFAKVLYCTQKNEGYPAPDDYLPGRGLPDVEWCDDLFSELSRADVVAFPAVGHCGLQDYLRKQGIPVFGSASAGRIELDRWFARDLQRETQLATPKGIQIKGIEALRNHLEECSDVYIKISLVRSAAETFHHTNPTASKPWLDNLAARLGPYGSLAEFVVEDPIDDAVEVGFDGFFSNGKFVQPISWGYEIKDSCFASTLSPLPARLQAIADKLTPLLTSYDYRGPISNEVRVTSSTAYQIDPTMRFGLPPSQLQAYQITNLGEVIYAVARGEDCEPEYKGRYGVQIILTSPWFEKHPLALEGLQDGVYVFGHCKIEGCDYAINMQSRYGEHLGDFGAACGSADSLESALEEALARAKEVKGLYVTYSEGDLTKATDTIKQGKKLGLQW